MRRDTIHFLIILGFLLLPFDVVMSLRGLVRYGYGFKQPGEKATNYFATFKLFSDEEREILKKLEHWGGDPHELEELFRDERQLHRGSHRNRKPRGAES